ncbi:MAG: Gfo/Idh/MocA family oxidoreductase [Spirosomaceae bacterium]|nr:Gfo/Idh/MocA family oxidoreductase [Spirosomataceae bacterium]
MNHSINHPILVIGAGSIGERHIGVLQSLGYEDIYVFRQRLLPFRAIETDSVHSFTDWNEVALIHPYAAVICTPTAQHLAQAQACVEQGMHVLVEKPLSHTLEEIASLRQAAQTHQKLVQVAYMLRYHPLMQQLKAMIVEDRFGRLVSFSTTWAEYLPNWHPWEDYRTSYAARKELGGGAALTLSHDLDIVSWLVGELPKNYHKTFNRRANLDVNVEAGATFLLEYPSGITGVVQLNYYQKIPKRTYELVFDEALVTLDYFKNHITVQTLDKTELIENEGFERNQMFEAQTIDFFKNTQSESVNARTEQYLNESEIIIEMCQ